MCRENLHFRGLVARRVSQVYPSLGFGMCRKIRHMDGVNFDTRTEKGIAGSPLRESPS